MPTTNPVPSYDPADLIFNAEKLDEVVNGTASTYTDRIGVQRRTLAGLEAEFPNAAANAAAAAGSAADAAEAAQIAQDEAVNAIEQASAAQTARTGAEAARDAAMLSAGVYASTSIGLANTNGTGDVDRYFSVPSADSAEYLILYLNNAGAAVEQKRYPAVSAISAIEEAVRRVEEQPNLFTRSQLRFSELPIAVGVTPVAAKVSGLDVVSVTTETTGGTSRIYWRFPVSMFPSGVVSAQITLMTDNGGSSGNIQIVQRNAGNTTIQTDTFATGVAAAISSPVTYRTSTPVAIAGTTAFVELNIALNKLSGDRLRTWTARGMMIADGNVSEFRFPPAVIPSVPSVSFFPNPSLTTTSSTLFEASTIIQNSETVLEMSGAGVVKQVFYETPATGVFAPENAVTWSMDVFSDVGGVGEDADITLIFLDGTGANIGSSAVASITVANAYQSISASLTVPAGSAKVRFRMVKRSSATVARFRRPIVTSTSPLASVVNQGATSAPSQAFRTVYVSTSGNDENDGNISTPLKTLATAIAKISPAGRIIMRAGDYSAGANVAGVGKVEITSYQGERVRIILGTKLAGVTKTAGYTKVYQASLAEKPIKWVWEHDTPDARTLISAVDRHPLQRGRQHRLPSTHLDEVASIAAIDAASTPSWYWSGGVLYFSASGGGDASALEYRVPTYVGSAVYGGTGIEDVMVENISVWYGGVYGFDARKLARWEADNCAAFCGGINGFSRDDTRFSVERLCESAGNNVDGFNSHRYGTNPTHEPVVSIVYDNWAHDNGDDGDSLHEDNVGTYHGGLYEYNGDRGIATAYGAHTVAYGTISRYNGQIDPVGGEGFSAIGAVVPGDDPGVGTQMDCYDCQSYGNRYNYSTGAADAKMTVVNSKSRNAGNTHFAALAGTIKLVDCGASGTGTLKSGSVTVENTTLVV